MLKDSGRVIHMDKDHNLRENLLLTDLVVPVVTRRTFFNQVGLLTGVHGWSSDLHYQRQIWALWPSVLRNLTYLSLYFVGRPYGVALTITPLTVLDCFVRQDHLYHVIQIAEIHALYAALLSGGLIGTGMLVIFRHKMSLGGFNILAVLTRTFWNSLGKVQMALRCRLLCCCLSLILNAGSSVCAGCDSHQLDSGDEP